MALPNTSEKSNALDREENITKGSLSAKKVALFTYDSGLDQLDPINSDNPLPLGSIDYDKQFSYTATTDIIQYELDAVLIKTKTVTYTDATKAVVDSVVWS